MIWLLLACTAPQGLDDAALAEAVAFGGGVDGAQMMQDVGDLIAARADEEPTSHPNWDDKPHYRVAAQEWLQAELAAMGLSVEEQRSDADGLETVNLWVDFPGQSRADELVLLSGHYDSFYSGADDNGSAVSVLLQAARLLQDAAPERTVRVLFFDREETTLLGSRRYFEARAEDEVFAVVNLDGVGFASSAPGSQGAPTGFTLPDVADFLGLIANGEAEEHAYIALQVAEAQDFKLNVMVSGLDHNNAVGINFHRSDHSPAWTRGLPALFLTDTANFRNPHYHKESDTLDTLNPEFLESSGRLAVALTLALANLE